MKIYTRSGDGGETSLFDGQRVSKAHARVASYGDVDELNACLGVVRAEIADEPRLADIDELLFATQRDLFTLGAILADPRRDEPGEDDADRLAGATRRAAHQVELDPGRIAQLEAAIDRWEEELPKLTQFVLPGGSRAAALLHVARTVARRAERHVVLLQAHGVSQPRAVTYLNRLSDCLFVASRVANSRLGQPEITWSGRD